jgi:predicted ATP-dependent protease
MTPASGESVNMDISKYRVSAEQARAVCDPDSFPFTCTSEIRPPGMFIGQERAVRSIEFGLGIDSPGYNIFVTGLSGTGKSTVIRSHIEAAVERRARENGGAKLYDWCYVFNFDRPDQPGNVRLARGKGTELVKSCEELLEAILKDLPAAFNDEAYTEQVRSINESMVNSRRELITSVEKAAGQRGFTVQAGPAGIGVIPLVDGKPMEQDVYLALTDEQRGRLEQVRSEVTRQVEQATAQIRDMEGKTLEQLGELQRKVVENTIHPSFARAMEKFKDEESEETRQFLEGLREYAMENAAAVISGQDDEQMRPGAGFSQPRDPQLPFRVNLFVDNSTRTAPPIIMDDNPTYGHLFGTIDRRPMMGAYVTDHTMLRAGSLAQANGGYLVIDARLALSHAAVWPALKRVLKGGEVRPEDPEDLMPGFLPPQPLRPEPIPIEVKVIFTGEPDIYQALAVYEPDFWEIVKVRADLSHQLVRDEDSMRAYGEFICGICNERDLKHFSADGVAAVIEFAMRVVDNQRKMTARFGLVVDLVVEAAYWAERESTEHTERNHVEKALEEREYRSGQVSDAIQELLLEGTLLVDIEGSKVGQVNGLAIYSAGDTSFGKPSRITTQAYMGRDGFINIEREARLSGQTHDKGVMILAGFLGNRFAQDFPLSVNISIAFEQSYGPVDGDSASSTELYSILSELSGAPVRQDIAVTGSVNQKGEVQAIGGANEKIEGFYDFCKAAGKLGEAGVLLPHSNLRNLMLRPEVVESIKKGEFHIYAAKTIDEGIEILTGVEAGSRDESGEFPPDSLNGRAKARLREFAEGLRKFQANPSAS